MEVWERGVDPYPKGLIELSHPPKVLYALGNRAVLDRPVVTVVGTRRATPYGERVTRAIATVLARAGACVLSGLALGIDTVAHIAALDAGGATCAMIANGLDVVAPPSHARVQAAIAERGLVLTEHALGTTPRPYSFPRRNRLMAAMARLVVVVEAGPKSGSLITANIALDLGRDVAAVPGPIDAPMSQGTNGLIRDGAKVVTDALDVLVLADLTTAPKAEPRLKGDQAAIWKALADGRLHAESLAVRCGMPAARCLAALSELELAGLISGDFEGTYRRA
jgi:DNA processing protein